ncbi:MAG: 1,4-alpha-glucan branching protein GlgB [SAR324 cluster bacterium]|nr:1,4-alpha-glucan branching protein GlgB [SAR324 cluster bacterium]
MGTIKLSNEEKDRLVSASHHAPRSLLGFHEVEKSDKTKVWVIRAMEPEAEKILLFWEKQKPEDAVPMKQIHSGGLFEVLLTPLASLVPYRLKIIYKDGAEHIRYDPYYFSPQLTEFDQYLFSEGNHHQIYQKLGAHLHTVDGISGTLFAVWAPNAKRVSVVASFNHWDGRKHLMQSMGSSGIWELFVPEVGEGAFYKYEIKTQADHILIKSDPYGYWMEHRPATASVVTNIDGYEWNDQGWMEHRANQDPLQQPINVYEMHFGSWKRIPEEGNRPLSYREAADDIVNYVKNLGYTHIELMPICEHPLDESWGYQVTGFFAASSRYGTPKELMYFIDRCHQEGIGIIVDWVPGHFPKDSNGLAEFDGSHLYEHMDPRIGEHKEWGTYSFNYGRHEVSNFLIANALFWFDYYHIDGIRVDAVASMLYLDYNREEGQWLANEYGGKENIAAIEFLRKLNSTLFHYFPGILSIAEESTAWPGVSHPTYTGGLGFNFKWNMGWMNDTLRFMELDSVYRKYDYHLLTFALLYATTENYILPLSHDEVVYGKRSLLNKMPGDAWQKRANLRMYLTYHIGHPGKKMLFMGAEIGQWDEWKATASLDWHLMDYPDHQQINEYCKSLNWFYRSHPALFMNDFDYEGFQWIDLHDHENTVISFMRQDATNRSEAPVIFVFNLTPVPRDQYGVGVPEPGRYAKLMDSDSENFGGSGYNKQGEWSAEHMSWQGQPYRLSVDLPPLGAIIIQKFADE